jgi:hypothetical protein
MKVLLVSSFYSMVCHISAYYGEAFRLFLLPVEPKKYSNQLGAQRSGAAYIDGLMI